MKVSVLSLDADDTGPMSILIEMAPFILHMVCEVHTIQFEDNRDQFFTFWQKELANKTTTTAARALLERAFKQLITASSPHP